jgi:hypothetical protein
VSRTARNDVLRGRIEVAIAIAAPALDLMLAIAERVSRLLGPEDPEPLATAARRDH